MNYKGLVTSDKLISDSVFNFVLSQSPDARPGITQFTAPADLAPAISEELSRQLQAGGYGVLESDFERIVVFSHKIFKFYPQDAQWQQKVADYAASLNIADGVFKI